MKKLAALCLIAAMGLQLTACSGIGNSSAWIEEGTAKIGATLDCGQFVVNGDVYSFPAGISDWTGNGWHISNNYDNKDSFELEAGVMSNEFEVFNDEADSQYVRMCALNLGSEPAKLESCTTDALKLKLSENKNDIKAVLPGGITSKSTMEDIIAAYGEPAQKDDNTICYTYTGKDDLIIEVEFRFPSETADQVVYTISEDNWGAIRNAEECSQFVDDALKTSFYNDYERYVANNFDTAESAQELYDSEVEYYVQGLMYYLDIEYETADEATLGQFRELTKKIFAKFKWDTPVVSLEDGASKGEVELTMYPTDFLDIILEDAQTVADTAQTEEEYVAGMLEAISPKVDEISYRDPVTNTYEIDIDNGVVSSEDWDEIDDILMDFAE